MNSEDATCRRRAGWANNLMFIFLWERICYSSLLLGLLSVAVVLHTAHLYTAHPNQSRIQNFIFKFYYIFLTNGHESVSFLLIEKRVKKAR
jgi:hypothetical protein